MKPTIVRMVAQLIDYVRLECAECDFWLAGLVSHGSCIPAHSLKVHLPKLKQIRRSLSFKSPREEFIYAPRCLAFFYCYNYPANALNWDRLTRILAFFEEYGKDVAFGLLCLGE